MQTWGSLFGEAHCLGDSLSAFAAGGGGESGGGIFSTGFLFRAASFAGILLIPDCISPHLKCSCTSLLGKRHKQLP